MKYLFSSIVASALIASTAFAVEPNTLLNIKVVDNWQPVKNYETLVSAEAFDYTGNGQWFQEKSKQFGYDKCISSIKNTTFKDSLNFERCYGWVIREAKHGNKDILADILLHWAESNHSFHVSHSLQDFNPKGYQIPSILGVYSQVYAIHYPSFNFKDEQRTKVDNYLSNWLMKQTFPNTGGSASKNPNAKCKVDVSEKAMIKSHMLHQIYFDNCGSVRYKVSGGEIMLGFRLGNQELLDKGHKDLYVNLAQFTSGGIGMTHAVKGANTLNYTIEYLRYMSIYTELYKYVDYDFLEHTLPHGAKVHEAISMGYKALNDVDGVLGKYAKANSQFPKYHKIEGMTHKEYLTTNFAENAYDYASGDKQFIRSHLQYVKSYNTIEIPNDIDMYMGSKTDMSAHMGVSPILMHFANQ